MIKAVIFDMDGLLINSEPFWVKAETEVLAGVGVPITSERTSETMAMRIDDVVEYWFKRYPWTVISRQEVAQKIVEKVKELIREKGEMMPGARNVIKLFAKEKMPMAIASSSATKIIDAFLVKTGTGSSINLAYSAEKELFGKPHPGVYITAAQKLGVNPEYCLAFEDSLNGVLSAKSARMKCIAVPSEAVAGDKRFCIADLTIKSLKDFKLEYLNKL